MGWAQDEERQVLSFITGLVLWVLFKLRALLIAPSTPSLDSVLPARSFYHDNRGRPIAGHITGDDKSHLFYSSIHKAEANRGGVRRRKEGRKGGGMGGFDGAFRRASSNGSQLGTGQKTRAKLRFGARVSSCRRVAAGGSK